MPPATNLENAKPLLGLEAAYSTPGSAGLAQALGDKWSCQLRVGLEQEAGLHHAQTLVPYIALPLGPHKAADL